MKFVLQAIAGLGLMLGVAHSVLLDADLSSTRPGVVIASEPMPVSSSVSDRMLLGLMPVSGR